MRKFAFVLGLGLMLPGQVFAQTAPSMTLPPGTPPPVAAPGPAAPAAAPAPQFSASHLAVSRELLAMTGTFNSFQNILAEFRANMLQANITRPELAKPIEEVVSGLKPDADRLVKVMEDRAAEFMAMRMSEAELKDVVGFFTSPTGKKYLEQRPVAMNDVFNALQPWSQLTSDFLFNRTKAELEKRGFKL